MSQTTMSIGEAQAQRLEKMLADIEAIVSRPEVAERLRAAPGEEEWNVLQILGHMHEMIPYWLNHCRTLIATEGPPPAFGRTLDSPERVEGVEHGENSSLDQIMDEMRAEVREGAAFIRGLTPEQRAKEGIHNRLGQITVENSIESFVLTHGEDHVAQLRAALGQ